MIFGNSSALALLLLGLLSGGSALAGQPVSDEDNLSAGTRVDFEITGRDFFIPRINSIRHDANGNPFFEVQGGRVFRGNETGFDTPTPLDSFCLVYLRKDATAVQSTDGVRPVGGKISLRSDGYGRDRYLHLVALNDPTILEIACSNFALLGPGIAGQIRSNFNGSKWTGATKNEGIVIATPTVVARNETPVEEDRRGAKPIAPAAIATRETGDRQSPARAI